MPRLAIIHDIEKQCDRGPLRWAYATRSHCLQKYAPDNWTVDRFSHEDTRGQWGKFNDYDILFILDYAMIGTYVRHGRTLGFRGPIVASFNKDHRSREKEWLDTLACADWTIVNNVDRWKYGGIMPRTCCISNGFDMRHWRSMTPWAERPIGAIWCGGTGPAKKKGYAEVIQPLEKMLHDNGFTSSFRPVTDITPDQVKTPDEQLLWYNQAKFVICASETEGTPGYLLEAMACGCIPITTYVGNVPEIFTKFAWQVVRDADRRAESYYSKIVAHMHDGPFWSAHASLAMQESWGYGHPANRSNYFFSLFDALIERGRDGVGPFNHWDCEPEDI